MYIVRRIASLYVTVPGRSGSMWMECDAARHACDQFGWLWCILLVGKMDKLFAVTMEAHGEYDATNRE